jgi:signal transduction histidine kinase
MGLLLLKMQQYEAAINHLNESLDWAKKLGAGGIVFRNYLGLAEVNIAQNKYEDAVLIAKLAKRYQREESYSDFNEQRYLRILYQAYDQQNRINEAYETLQDLQQLNEKLLNAEVARQIGRMEAQSQYEIERLQEQRFQMQKEAQYQATITKQRVYLLAGLLIGVILLFFGVAYARSYTLMKRKNILLQQQKEEIEFLKDHLDDLVKERTREVEEKGQRISDYAYTNAHHLRGPLARILALIDAMKLEGYPSQKEYQFSLEALYKSAREMDKVVRDINEQLGE